MSRITLESIHKSYGKVSILKDFYLEIKDGEFVSIIGGSGSGKTTVLKLINGILTPEHGCVCIDNMDISKTNQNELRRNIGYVIQNIGLFPHMSIKENITYVLHLKKMKKSIIDERVKELMQVVELEESLLDRFPDELSGGQKQRVGIARALAAKPSLLLMDEPFGAVDEITRRSLQDEIKKIHKQLKITIIFVTHDIREALRLSDRVVVMKDGSIEQFDTPHQLIQHPTTAFCKQLLSFIEL
ncbi:MAG: ABC transporter ATP-binding protein [Longicatena sp.]